MERKQSLILWYLRSPFKGSGFVILLFTPLEKGNIIQSIVKKQRVIKWYIREGEGEGERGLEAKKRRELDPEKRTCDRTSILFLSLIFSLFPFHSLSFSLFEEEKRGTVQNPVTHAFFLEWKDARIHSHSFLSTLDAAGFTPSSRGLDFGHLDSFPSPLFRKLSLFLSISLGLCDSSSGKCLPLFLKLFFLSTKECLVCFLDLKVSSLFSLFLKKFSSSFVLF